MFRRKPKHKALLITDDHCLLEVNLDVDAGFVVDHRSNRSWALMPKAVIRLRGTRTPYLVLYERSAAPYSPKNRKWETFDEGAVNRLARERIAQQFAELPKLAIAEKAANTFRLCIAGLTLTVAIMALTVLITSGKIGIPGL
ncbi:MAG: hypothetical protein GX600_01575 [Dehalococcoidia bacterium]|nr:hypothetical protein [Dehalococcoidia bacterium]